MVPAFRGTVDVMRYSSQLAWLATSCLCTEKQFRLSICIIQVTKQGWYGTQAFVKHLTTVE